LGKDLLQQTVRLEARDLSDRGEIRNLELDPAHVVLYPHKCAAYTHFGGELTPIGKPKAYDPDVAVGILLKNDSNAGCTHLVAIASAVLPVQSISTGNNRTHVKARNEGYIRGAEKVAT
jgi:hypothetical protein